MLYHRCSSLSVPFPRFLIFVCGRALCSLSICCYIFIGELESWGGCDVGWEWCGGRSKEEHRLGAGLGPSRLSILRPPCSNRARENDTTDQYTNETINKHEWKMVNNANHQNNVKNMAIHDHSEVHLVEQACLVIELTCSFLSLVCLFRGVR